MTRIGIRSHLSWRDSLSEALAAVGQRPARALLTALGTLLGVGAFVATTGLATSARAQVSSRFDALKATEVRVEDIQPDGTNPFPDDVDRRLERLNGVRSAGLLYNVQDTNALMPRSTPIRPIGGVPTVGIIAATPGALTAAQVTVSSGRTYDQFHERRAENVAVLGIEAAATLGITRVDNQPAVFIGDTAFTVLGIIDGTQRQPELLRAIIVPTSTERARISTSGSSFEVLIDTDQGAAQLIGRQAPMALRPQHPERLRSLVPPSPESLRNIIESDVTALYLALAGLSLLIGTIAIANATLLNTIERRPEIGLRRALGARKEHIARQITLEATIIGGLGGIAGTSLAICGLAAFCEIRDWTMTLDSTTTLTAPIIGLGTGAIAGVLPAIRAARTPPATTLRA
jgi:putative ABC transport system permease protein